MLAMQIGCLISLVSLLALVTGQVRAETSADDLIEILADGDRETEKGLRNALDFDSLGDNNLGEKINIQLNLNDISKSDKPNLDAIVSFLFNSPECRQMVTTRNEYCGRKSCQKPSKRPPWIGPDGPWGPMPPPPPPPGPWGPPMPPPPPGPWGPPMPPPPPGPWGPPMPPHPEPWDGPGPWDSPWQRPTRPYSEGDDEDMNEDDIDANDSDDKADLRVGTVEYESDSSATNTGSHSGEISSIANGQGRRAKKPSRRPKASRKPKLVTAENNEIVSNDEGSQSASTRGINLEEILKLVANNQNKVKKLILIVARMSENPSSDERNFKGDSLSSYKEAMRKVLSELRKLAKDRCSNWLGSQMRSCGSHQRKCKKRPKGDESDYEYKDARKDEEDHDRKKDKPFDETRDDDMSYKEDDVIRDEQDSDERKGDDEEEEEEEEEENEEDER